MGLFTLSANQAAVLSRISCRAWLLIGLSMIWQFIAATGESTPVIVGAASYRATSRPRMPWSLSIFAALGLILPQSRR